MREYYNMHWLLDFGVCFTKVTILRKGHGNREADRAALELARFVMLKSPPCQQFSQDRDFHKDVASQSGRHVEARVLGNKFVQSLGG
jgi:hypothetical protein